MLHFLNLYFFLKKKIIKTLAGGQQLIKKYYHISHIPTSSIAEPNHHNSQLSNTTASLDCSLHPPRSTTVSEAWSGAISFRLFFAFIRGGRESWPTPTTAGGEVEDALPRRRRLHSNSPFLRPAIRKKLVSEVAGASAVPEMVR